MDTTESEQLDPEAQAGLEAIVTEGEQAEQAERAEQLESEQARREDPYDPKVAGALEILNTGLFGIAAGRRGAHWRLTEAEAEELSKVQAQCVERYVGSVNVGPAVALIFTTAGIVAPRLNQDAQLVAEYQRRQAEKAEQTAEAEAGQGPSAEVPRGED